MNFLPIVSGPPDMNERREMHKAFTLACRDGRDRKRKPTRHRQEPRLNRGVAAVCLLPRPTFDRAGIGRRHGEIAGDANGPRAQVGRASYRRGFQLAEPGFRCPTAYGLDGNFKKPAQGRWARERKRMKKGLNHFALCRISGEKIKGGVDPNPNQLPPPIPPDKT